MLRYLAKPTDDQIHEFILNQFVVLWEDYESARMHARASNPHLSTLYSLPIIAMSHITSIRVLLRKGSLIPAGNLVEVSLRHPNTVTVTLHPPPSLSTLAPNLTLTLILTLTGGIR